LTNASGAATSINAYDEYGVPGSSNSGRFQYTGQAWISEASLHHYKARAYSPALGRFLQTDPILWAGGMNLYAYVGNDPVNWIDPLGLTSECDSTICVPAPCWGANCNTSITDPYEIARFLEWLDPEVIQIEQLGPVDTFVLTEEQFERQRRDPERCSTLRANRVGTQMQISQLQANNRALAAYTGALGYGAMRNAQPGMPFENRPGAGFWVTMMIGAAFGSLIAENQAALDSLNRSIGAIDQEMRELGCSSPIN
jgi:RHS repeat-associated protein